jgi:hypothetical protein
MPCFLIIFYVFFFYKIGEQEGGTGSAQMWGSMGELVQVMYTPVSKCKNNKIKLKPKSSV